MMAAGAILEVREREARPARRRFGARLASSLLGMLIFLAAGSPALAQEVGVVIAIRGEVYVERGGQRVAAQEGLALEPEDRLETVGDSRAQFRLAAGLVVTLGPDTSLSLAEIRQQGEDGPIGTTLELVRGLIRALFEPETGGGKVEVRTNLAVTSVRSTEWTVEAVAAKTSVFVREGRVAVRPLGQLGGVTLTAGEGVDVTPGAGTLEAKVWGAKRVEDTLRRTGL